MKSIDSVYDLICILSDTRSFDQEETIKVGRIMFGRRETCQKIRRRAEGSVNVSVEGFGPWVQASGQEEHKSCQGNRSYGGQLADWAIGHKRGRCAEKSDEASINQ